MLDLSIAGSPRYTSIEALGCILPKIGIRLPYQSTEHGSDVSLRIQIVEDMILEKQSTGCEKTGRGLFEPTVVISLGGDSAHI